MMDDPTRDETKCPECGADIRRLACPGGCFTVTLHEPGGVECLRRQLTISEQREAELRVNIAIQQRDHEAVCNDYIMQLTDLKAEAQAACAEFVESIPAALSEYRCQHMVYENHDDGMALVDVFSQGSDIATIKPGLDELELLADFIQSYKPNPGQQYLDRLAAAEETAFAYEQTRTPPNPVHARLIHERDQAQAACAVMRESIDTIRDWVLYQRGPLAENGMTSDQVNDVLAVIDENTFNNPGQPLLDRLAAQAKEIAGLKADWEEVSSQNDECHQPASNYELLLDKLNGVPTNHGDCPVAKKLDEQAAEIERLRTILAATRAAALICGAQVAVCKPYMSHLVEMIDAADAALAGVEAMKGNPNV